MAKFKGNLREFERFIGPLMRNIVQNKISRNYKKHIGECEFCGNKENLEAAHIHGKSRRDLIKSIFGTEQEHKEIDLEDFEDKFIKIHFPLEETFKILCKPCHQEYDKNHKDKSISKFNKAEINREIIDDFKTELKFISSEENRVLPIELYPPDPIEFKELLLKTKTANIKIIYNNGLIEQKAWKAENFTESSNLWNNIRSRSEFRKEEWKKNNINRVEIEISNY